MVLVLIGALTAWSATEYLDAVKWRSHSKEVIRSIALLRTSIYETISHHRGYFLVSDSNSLRRYIQAKDSTRTSLYKLGQLISDNPEQLHLLQQASANILARLSALESALETLQQNKRPLSMAMMNEDIRQQSHIDDVAALLSRLDLEEQKLLATRETKAQGDFLKTSILVMAGITTAFLLFLCSTLLWQHEMKLRRKAESDLQNLNKKIKKESDLKSRFLTNMSHEIRTPLNGITGMSKMLEHTSLDEKQADYVETIKTASQALLALINDILDLSRIESGKFQLEEINFELASLMKSTVSIVDFAARAKKLHVRIEMSPDIPDFLMGDPLRIRQILLNLLNNAIKFSEQGDVIVKVHHRIVDSSSLLLIFEVIDQGIGFDQETKARLFKSFSQGDESTSRKYGGSGLGLSISKQIVDLMKGHIDAESIKGVGSKFFFEIPLRIAKYGSESPTHHTIRDLTQQLHGIVLIAEDNRINQKVMAEMVGLLGCRYQVVENGVEVLEALKNQSFDIVLMDGQMPVMDGYEATRKIRDGAAGPQNILIPILATSANAIKGDIERSLEAGMNDYISKPISYSDLSVKLEKWLHQGASAIDERHLLKLHDQESRSGKILVPDLIEIFLQDTPRGLQQMQSALDKKDLKSMRSVAHNLKTSGAVLGVLRFKDIAERIERAPEDTNEEQMSLLLRSLNREAQFAMEALRKYKKPLTTPRDPEAEFN